MKITKEMTKASYSRGKAVYLKKVSRNEAIDDLFKNFGMSKGSAGDFITNFLHMINAQKYTRTINEFSTNYFLTKISEDFNLEKYQNAINAGYLHVEYYANLPKGGNLLGIKDILDKHNKIAKSISGCKVYSDDDYDQEYQKDVAKSESSNITDKPVDRLDLKTAKGTSLYPRNTSYAKQALKEANFSCEISFEHKTFKQKSTNNNYSEAHHLIPIKFYENFEISIDVPANIVSLCPTCHRLLHFGKIEEILPILKILFERREKRLETCNILITIELLKSYYQ